MRRLFCYLMILALALTGTALAGGTAEYITDVDVQARAIQSENPTDSVADAPSASNVIIEDAAVTESATAAAEYADIARGDQGDAVTAIQNRLIQLGYLSDLNVDGVYGRNTCTAMHAFKIACGIDEADPHNPENCPATAAAQALLFSDAAVPYNDPEFPVVLLHDSGIHAKEQGDYLTFRPTIANQSKSRTVTSVTLTCYATDIWGNRVVGENVSYDWTTVREIAPASTAEADAMTVPQRVKIAWLYVAITNVTFADGAELIPETPEYIGWTPVEW